MLNILDLLLVNKYDKQTDTHLTDSFPGQPG